MDVLQVISTLPSGQSLSLASDCPAGRVILEKAQGEFQAGGRPGQW